MTVTKFWGNTEFNFCIVVYKQPHNVSYARVGIGVVGAFLLINIFFVGDQFSAVYVTGAWMRQPHIS